MTPSMTTVAILTENRLKGRISIRYNNDMGNFMKRNIISPFHFQYVVTNLGGVDFTSNL